MSTGVASAQRSSPTGSVWLHGPRADLLLGYGAAYLLCVPVLIGASLLVEDTAGLLWLYGVISLAVITPHYGATALRVYEERQERQRYAFFAVWVTAALILLFGVSLYDRFLGSLLFTVYVSWSPWHFSGQNYGLAVMYLRRSGVEVGPELKRPLYASFILSALLAIMAIHIANSSTLFAQASDYAGTFQVIQLGFPPVLGLGAALIVAVAYLAALGLFARRLAAQPVGLRAAPLALLVCTQALWFALPGAAVAAGAQNVGSLLPFTAFVVSAAHSAQYLWVTSYYARLGGAGTRTAPFLAKAIVAGSALYVPGFLFVPGLLGPVVPNGAGVLLFAFAVLNLHHFILDGAIWKLRDGRVARALLRSEATNEVAGTGAGAKPPRHWLRPLVWAVGIAGVLIKLQIIGLEVLSERADDLSVLQGTARQLTFLGQDQPEQWGRLGIRLESTGDASGAIEAYRGALGKQEPDDLQLAQRLALLLITTEADDPGSLDEATRLGAYLAESLGTASPSGFQTLAAAHAAAGRYAEASQAAHRAAEIAHANGSIERARQIRRDAARYELLIHRADSGATH